MVAGAPSIADGADLEANGVPLCRDRAGADRAAVHARLQGIILRFLDRL